MNASKLTSNGTLVKFMSVLVMALVIGMWDMRANVGELRGDMSAVKANVETVTNYVNQLRLREYYGTGSSRRQSGLVFIGSHGSRGQGDAVVFVCAPEATYADSLRYCEGCAQHGSALEAHQP